MTPDLPAGQPDINDPMPVDPFPNPAETPVPSEQPPADPIGIPQPGPDVVKSHWVVL